MRKPKNQMVRITSGAVPRLRLMSVRTNRGRRFGALVAFALSFLLVASGFYGANSLAQSGEPWDGNPVNGDVEVEGSVSAISLRAGESRSYRIRLSRQPKTNGWWVRIFVNGAQRSDGEYFENGEKVISWVPSVGWQFDVDNHQDPNQPTQWRTITFRAHQDINTPIKIMHEVWEDNTNCPIHERGKITVSSEPTPPDAPVRCAPRRTARGRSTSPGMPRMITARTSHAMHFRYPTTALPTGRISRVVWALRPDRTITPIFHPGRESTTAFRRATREAPAGGRTSRTRPH